jgi:rubrerythrin
MPSSSLLEKMIAKPIKKIAIKHKKLLKIIMCKKCGHKQKTYKNNSHCSVCAKKLK